MDPSSETTYATHCIQSSTSSELLHAKKTSGRTRKKGGEERAGGAGGENKLNNGGICWELNFISHLSDLLASNGIVTKLKIEIKPLLS